MEEKLIAFGKRLKMLRKEKKQKQKDIADLLGIAERNYQRLEYGETNISATNLIVLCDYFQVSADFLLGRTEIREINR